MPSAVGETSAVRHAHLGQASRSSLTGADSSDQTNPFAALLDATDVGAPLPAAPTLPSLALASLKPSLRPQDVQQAPTDGTASAKTDTSAVNTQTVPLPTQGGTPATAVATTTPDPTAGQDATRDLTNNANAPADPAPAIPVADAAAAASTANANVAGSTSAAIPDTHSDKPKSDTKSDQSTSPPVDASANLAAPTPQPPAAPVNTPSLPSAPPAVPKTADANDGIEPGGDEIAAAGGQSPAGAGKAGGQSPDASASGAAKPPSNPQSQQNPIASAEASRQAGAADAAQASAANAASAASAAAAADTAANGAAANARARRTADNESNDGSDQQDASQSGSSADPNTGASAATSPNGSPSLDQSDSTNSDSGSTTKPAQTSKIEDAARAALGSAPTASAFAATGSAHAGNLPADGTQAAAAGVSTPAAPAILTTAAAPAIPVDTSTPVAVPISGLAVEIAASAQAGNNQFEIRLDPPELGRIEVQLSVDHDGKVTSRLVADRPETLDLLKRDAGDLQRSLEQAGLQTSDNGLQFSLRDQGGFAGQNPYSNNSSSGNARIIIPDQETPTIETGAAAYGRALGATGGVDIRV